MKSFTVQLVMSEIEVPSNWISINLLLPVFLNVQATIGIDFLSKTMYLEDRTVRLQLWWAVFLIFFFGLDMLDIKFWYFFFRLAEIAVFNFQTCCLKIYYLIMWKGTENCVVSSKNLNQQTSLQNSIIDPCLPPFGV